MSKCWKFCSFGFCFVVVFASPPTPVQVASMRGFSVCSPSPCSCRAAGVSCCTVTTTVTCVSPAFHSSGVGHSSMDELAPLSLSLFSLCSPCEKADGCLIPHSSLTAVGHHIGSGFYLVPIRSFAAYCVQSLTPFVFFLLVWQPSHSPHPLLLQPTEL